MNLLEETHPALARAHAQDDAAWAGTTLALSGLLPSLTLGGSYTRNNEEAIMDLAPLFEVIGGVAEAMGQAPVETPDPLTLQPLQSFSGSATLRVPLLVPASWASLSASHDTVDAVAAASMATLSSLRTTAYLAILSTAATESLAAYQKNSLDRAQKLLSAAEAAFQAGTAPRIDVLIAKTEISRREGLLLQTIAARDKGRVAVGMALGVGGPVVVEDDPALGMVAYPDRIVTSALEHRGEVQAAMAQVEAARNQLRAVQWGALPSLSASLTGFSSTEPYVTGENYGWKASLDLSWTVATGGMRLGSLQKAQAMLAEAEANLALVQLQVTSQANSALLDWNSAKTQVEMARQQHALAEELATLAQRNLELGVGDALRVIDSLERLDQASVGRVDAETRREMAVVQLFLATGEW